jgi:hypothetical protein
MRDAVGLQPPRAANSFDLAKKGSGTGFAFNEAAM